MKFKIQGCCFNSNRVPFNNNLFVTGIDDEKSIYLTYGLSGVDEGRQIWEYIDKGTDYGLIYCAYYNKYFDIRPDQGVYTPRDLVLKRKEDLSKQGSTWTFYNVQSPSEYPAFTLTDYEGQYFTKRGVSSALSDHAPNPLVYMDVLRMGENNMGNIFFKVSVG